MDNAPPHIHIESVKLMTDPKRKVFVSCHGFAGRNVKDEVRALLEDPEGHIPGYPPSSPDFNPCELLISVIKARGYKYFWQSEVKTLQNFVDCVEKATLEITPEAVNNAFKHCYKCMEQCILNGGDYGDCVTRRQSKHKDAYGLL
jgi:hypothetical protein